MQPKWRRRQPPLPAHPAIKTDCPGMFWPIQLLLLLVLVTCLEASLPDRMLPPPWVVYHSFLLSLTKMISSKQPCNVKKEQFKIF